MVTDGRLAKVRRVEPEFPRVYLDFPGNLSGHFVPSDATDWKEGDVLFIPNEGEPQIVASELWPEATDVGTVRATTPDRAVIEVDGKLRSYLQRQPSPFVKGQTVEIDSAGNPGKVLSGQPIDRLGLLDRDDFDIESLIVRPGDNDTTLDDFGGSRRLVDRALDLVTVALDPAERLKEIGAKPIKGILFTGPSGTGKTYLAKALANTSSAIFYNIGGPVIVDQFVGQSERRLRSIFEHAAANRPAILFFDEIDSLYTQRGSGTHEATNRLVGQFLSLLDGFTPFTQVIVIATTNLPGALDNALLRPGRLGHKLVFVPPDTSNRVAILEASSRNLHFSEQPRLEEIAELTHGWTAADLAAIWTEASILAVLDGRAALCGEDVREALSKVQRVSTHHEMSDRNHDVS